MTKMFIRGGFKETPSGLPYYYYITFRYADNPADSFVRLSAPNAEMAKAQFSRDFPTFPIIGVAEEVERREWLSAPEGR